ncbi:MAG: glycosyltransferase family 4 protein [Candidatus Wallbacteria bacterium]
MNILHISRHYWPVLGGAELVIHDFTAGLNKFGCNCKILCINRNTINNDNVFFPEYEKIDNIDVYRVAAYGSYKKPFLSPFEYLKVIKLLKWADIVHVHDIRFLLETVCFFKLIFKYKLFLNSNGFLFHTDDFNYIKKNLFDKYYPKIFNIFFNKILAISERDFNLINFVNEPKKVLFESAINISKYFNIEKKVIRNNFIYFGRIDKNKGLENLFINLKMLDQKWILNIVGTGEERYINNLKKMTNELKISKNINWLGKLQENELFEEIAKTHIAFFPSLEEGFGITFLESISTGTITIGNNIPTFQKISKDVNCGIIVDFANTEKTLNVIKEIIKNTNDDSIYISKENFVKYDINEKIKLLIDLYKN